MKFIVKVCGRNILLDEAQLTTFVELMGEAEIFASGEYVGHNKGTYGKNMEYIDSIKTERVHDWIELKPLDMNLYGTLKLVQKLEDE